MRHLQRAGRRLAQAGATTFRSLRVRNYRLFFMGQLVSVSGTWMQWTAQDWLVLQLTHSGVAVGITTAAQFTPILFAGLWGGHLGDRFDRRRVLMWTQAAAATIAFALGAVVALGIVAVWMIWLAAFLTGCVTVIDNPTRQAFLPELVGPDEVPNAVGLNSSVVTGARIVGPAVAGILIATVGTAWAFALNGISYFAVIGSLVAMDSARLHAAARPRDGKARVRDGLRYVWRTNELRSIFALLAVVATLGMNFRVALPILTSQVFHAGAATFGLLTSVMAVGSCLGALASAARAKPTGRLAALSAFAFGVLSLGVAFMPSLATAGILLFPMGAAAIVFMTTSNAFVQLAVSQEMRGRVMALFAVVFLGSNPIGGPLVGWVSQAYGARAAIAIGGLSSIVAAIVAAVVVSRQGWRDPTLAERREPEAPQPPATAPARAAA